MRFIEECVNNRIRVLNTASSARFDFFNLKICLTPRYITCLSNTYRAIDPKFNSKIKFQGKLLNFQMV